MPRQPGERQRRPEEGEHDLPAVRVPGQRQVGAVAFGQRAHEVGMVADDDAQVIRRHRGDEAFDLLGIVSPTRVHVEADQ